MASDLVGTTTLVPPAELHHFHRNARIGDVDAIASSLIAHGQYTPIIVNTGDQTGRPNEVLAGNHTLMAFQTLAVRNPFEKQWNAIKVHWVDVDDTGADRINIVDNRAFEQGEGIDTTIAFEMLKELETLDGTGYGQADLDAMDKLMDGVEPPAEPDPKPPPPDRAERAIGYTIVFDDHDQEQRWFEFVKWLKTEYEDDDLTLAERLIEHLDATAGQRA